jgi:hypothetical protein
VYSKSAREEERNFKAKNNNMKKFAGGVTDISSLGKEDKNKPLLSITLPAPPNMDSKAPVSYGAHNAAHQNNYKEIGILFQKIIKVQEVVIQQVQDLTEEVEKLKEKNLENIE